MALYRGLTPREQRDVGIVGMWNGQEHVTHACSHAVLFQFLSLSYQYSNKIFNGWLHQLSVIAIRAQLFKLTSIGNET